MKGAYRPDLGELPDNELAPIPLKVKWKKCPRCGGSKTVIIHCLTVRPCPRCHGRGKVERDA